MAYPVYPEYLQSDDDWLGEIPAHWNHLRADFTTESNKLQVRVSEMEDKKVLHFSIPNVQEYGTAQIQEGEDIDSSKLRIRETQLLVSKLNPRKATICIASPHEEFLTVSSGEFVPILPKNDLNLRYCYYAWLSDKVTKLLSSKVQSVTRSHQRVNPDDIRKLQWAWPTAEEQKQIANFLDWKTGQIDALIAKKQQLIEKLQEQRIAIITQTVTKGLNPDAPMRDSGISWIGDIPEHWGIRKLRHLGTTKNGISESAEYFGSGHPFVSYSDVYGNEKLPSKVSGLARSSAQEQSMFSIREGDVLFTRTSETAEEIAISSTCFQTIEHSIFAGFLIRFRPESESGLTKEYSKYYFRSSIHRNFFNKEMNLVTRVSLGQDLLKKLPVLLPPQDEQKEIGRFLDSETGKTDALTLKVKAVIDRLTEYRTALITAATTGKIDVRNVKLSNEM